jgi:hypothetical protein
MNKKILWIAAIIGAGMGLAHYFANEPSAEEGSPKIVRAIEQTSLASEKRSDHLLLPHKQAVNARDRIIGLVAEGDGAALLEAHRIVAVCIREAYFARKFSGKPPDKVCEQISATYANSYLQWLDKAIADKTVGAATAFLEAGPFGDLDSSETRGTDPLVSAWKSKAIDLLERDAQARDVQAALSLYEQYRNGAITDIEVPKAFASLVVAKELLVAEGNKKMEEAAQKELDRLSKQLDQEKMTEAYKYVDYLKQKSGS